MTALPLLAAAALGGLTIRTMLATGRSQSAFRLVTYVNAIHPLTHLFDGYLVHSRGANASGFNAEGLARDAENAVPPGAISAPTSTCRCGKAGGAGVSDRTLTGATR